MELDRELKEGSLEPFVNDVSLAEKYTKPPKQTALRLSEKPIEPQQKKSLDLANRNENFEDMDEIGQYRTMIDNGVSPELAEKESKLKAGQLDRSEKKFDASYKAHEEFINETTNKFKAYETETKPRLLQMQKLATDDELIGPLQ